MADRVGDPPVVAPAWLAVRGTDHGSRQADTGAPEPQRLLLNWGRRFDVWMFNVGLACCAVEVVAASMRRDNIDGALGPGDGFATGPRQANVMVVSGTVTDKIAPAVERLYTELAEPRYVISFGSCANCGGPYWDSYCVTKGVDQLVPVDVYVPGCPPRPEALLHAIRRLEDVIAAGRRVAS